MARLTESQQKVYDFLVKTMPSGVPPTVREICTATGLRSTSTVHAHLKTLEKLGYINREVGLNRAIRIEGSQPAAQVPILGRVTAGIPILAVEDIEGYMLQLDGNIVVDLGDDAYTQGKPHPMIDPAKRIECMQEAVDDPTTGAVLLDIMLGYGSHADMAGALLPSIVALKEKAEAQGRKVFFIATV